MTNGYIACGLYVIDTNTDESVAKVTVTKMRNLIAEAEEDMRAKNMAKIIAAAMNAYNEAQGGI